MSMLRIVVPVYIGSVPSTNFHFLVEAPGPKVTYSKSKPNTSRGRQWRLILGGRHPAG